MTAVILRLAACVAALSAALPAGAQIRSASIETGSGDRTYLARIGVQTVPWERRWFAAGGKHLGGHWDATLAAWRLRHYQDVPHRRKDIVSLGLTPVLRYGRDDGRGFYIEGGIGLHYLGALYHNDGSRLSTRFQFGDHVGAGWVTDDGWDLAVKVQHFSNGGIRKPNNGVNFLVFKAARRF